MRWTQDDRGNAMVSTMVGGLIGMLMLGLVGAGILAFSNSYMSITSSSVMVAKKALITEKFRTDLTWASNIPSATADPTKFTAVIPDYADHTCIEVTWQLKTVGARKELIRSEKNFTETIKPEDRDVSTAGSATGTSMCGGSMRHQSIETLLDDAGADAAFTHRNKHNWVLERVGAEMQTTSAANGSDLETKMARSSTRIAGVTLDAKLNPGGAKSANLKLTHYSKNLESKNIPVESYDIVPAKMGAQ